MPVQGNGRRGVVKKEFRYKTASGLRMALEERLNRLARKKGMDVMRLRRHVAFDRFLARVFSVVLVPSLSLSLSPFCL
jgi:hypothetical protein